MQLIPHKDGTILSGNGYVRTYRISLLLILSLIMGVSFAHAQHQARKTTAYEQHEAAKQSVVLLKNESAIPVQELGEIRIASLTLGGRIETPFKKTLARYAAIQQYVLLNRAGETIREELIKQLKGYDLLIIAVHPDGRKAEGSDAYSPELIALIKTLASQQSVILTLFDEAKVLTPFVEIAGLKGLLLGQGNGAAIQEVAGQVIFGGIGAQGKLRNAPMLLQKALESEGGLRFEYTSPDAVGWNADRLARRIDSVVKIGLDSMAFPGCQVLVAKDRKVVFAKTYGHHTYDRKRAVRETDLYDFASVTKTTGPLPALMKLHGEGNFDLDKPLSHYWTDWQKSNKAGLSIREILAHQARLKPYIVYYLDTYRKNGKFKGRTFKADSSKAYSVKVDEDFFLHHKYRQRKIYKAIRESELNEKPGYVYSGLSFLIYPQMIQNLSGQTYEDYVQTHFYRPLGAHTLTFNPAKHFPMERIVPTELDTFFRHKQLHGYVHDEAAAMFGGVSGNAGLFGTANDLAKLYQMYMDMGEYGAKRYLSKSTLSEFTAYQFVEDGNRRGLGFDKPLLEKPERGYIAPSASPESFGHSGYTGTFVWADPEHDILIVFFSNRVHPTRGNTKLYSLGFRPALHEVLYREMRGE